jgi:hypothetical protein
MLEAGSHTAKSRPEKIWADLDPFPEVVTSPMIS